MIKVLLMAHSGKKSMLLPGLGLKVQPPLPPCSVSPPTSADVRVLQPSGDQADKAAGLGDGRETRWKDPRLLNDLGEPNSLPI